MSIVPRDPYVSLTGTHRLLLDLDYPPEHLQRCGVAMRLALDLETCVALLEGRPVDPVRIDQVELARAREATLVRLVAPIELLDPVMAAA